MLNPMVYPIVVFRRHICFTFLSWLSVQRFSPQYENSVVLPLPNDLGAKTPLPSLRMKQLFNACDM
jgi:hypothetical protein